MPGFFFVEGVMGREEQRRILIEYLRMKVAVEDWHGASDACNDLREIDAGEAELSRVMRLLVAPSPKRQKRERSK